jgi:leader peptidase (prepilin peptidase)/N-methyltransferase
MTPVYALAGLLGAIFGSFLNVVIHRGPTLWGLVGDDRRAKGTLVGPRSRCPSCGATIRALDLVPVLSFFLLKGRCRACSARISPRYPLVEIAGAAALVLPLAFYGLNIAAGGAAIFLLALIALAAIDFETGYLPEAITLPLIALGLLANLVNLYTDGLSALIGAVAGYGSFFAISTGYKALRGREGLGLGDAALFSGLGAWGGWRILAPAAFLAALTALGVIALAALVRGKPIDGARELPFGPALAAGGATAFFLAQAGLPFLR